MLYNVKKITGFDTSRITFRKK